jgi:hypothetical protein
MAGMGWVWLDKFGWDRWKGLAGMGLSNEQSIAIAWVKANKKPTEARAKKAARSTGEPQAGKSRRRRSIGGVVSKQAKQGRR